MASEPTAKHLKLDTKTTYNQKFLKSYMKKYPVFKESRKADHAGDLFRAMFTDSELDIAKHFTCARTKATSIIMYKANVYYHSKNSSKRHREFEDLQTLFCEKQLKLLRQLDMFLLVLLVLGGYH